MPLLVKIVLGLVAVWAVFGLLGWIFKAFIALVVIAGVVTLGAVGYAAIKGKTTRQIKP